MNEEMLNKEDEFLKAAQEIEDRERAKENKGVDPELMELYKSLKFCCLSENHTYKVFRMLGHSPKLIENVSQEMYTDPILVHQVEVLGDNKKSVKFILPDRDQTDSARDHLLYRIYDKICEFDWVERKRVFRWEEIYKDLFLWANKGGFVGNKGKFCRGLYPNYLLIQNVIDRSDMKWHKENKKTKILAKNSFEVTVKSEEGDYKDTGYTVGVPYNSCSNIWKDLWRKYGSWENFDVAIRPAKKAGDNTIPMSILNASRLKEKDMFDDIGEKWAGLIQVGPLTEEEQSWERFNLGKAYSISSYSKISKRIGKRLAAIDEAFGTKFSQECKDLASTEAKLRKEKQQEGEDQFEEEDGNIEADKVSVSVPKDIPSEKPAPKRRSLLDETKKEVPAIDTSVLKGWALLSAEEKAQVESAVKDQETGKCLSIKFKASAGALAPCANPTCGVSFPEDWLVCPCCGAKFEAIEE